MDIKTIESIGTPFYVFDIDVLKNRINYLKSMLPKMYIYVLQ